MIFVLRYHIEYIETFSTIYFPIPKLDKARGTVREMKMPCQEKRSAYVYTKPTLLL